MQESSDGRHLILSHAEVGVEHLAACTFAAALSSDACSAECSLCTPTSWILELEDARQGWNTMRTAEQGFL